MDVTCGTVTLALLKEILVLVMMIKVSEYFHFHLTHIVTLRLENEFPLAIGTDRFHPVAVQRS